MMSLLAAVDFVEVAIAACKLCRDLGIAECSVFLHAPSGRPLLVIDNLASDDPRRTMRIEAWYLDPFLTAVRHQRVPVGDDGTLVLPLVAPRGMLGSLWCYGVAMSAELRRALENVADHVAVRLTDLGVTTSAPALTCLTPRQQDVAQLAASGRTNQEIGDVLGLSENTVKKHLKDIYTRLDVSNRTALAGMLAAIVPQGVHDDIPLGVSMRGEITITRCA